MNDETFPLLSSDTNAVAVVPDRDQCRVVIKAAALPDRGFPRYGVVGRLASGEQKYFSKFSPTDTERGSSKYVGQALVFPGDKIVIREIPQHPASVMIMDRYTGSVVGLWLDSPYQDLQVKMPQVQSYAIQGSFARAAVDSLKLPVDVRVEAEVPVQNGKSFWQFMAGTRITTMRDRESPFDLKAKAVEGARFRVLLRGARGGERSLQIPAAAVSQH